MRPKELNVIFITVQMKLKDKPKPLYLSFWFNPPIQCWAKELKESRGMDLPCKLTAPCKSAQHSWCRAPEERARELTAISPAF